MKKNISRAIFFLFILVSFPESVNALKISPEEYIAKYKDIAIGEMKEHGIPASITLAQGGLESNWGNSELAVKANNHFGIKCHSGWDGATYRIDAERKKECFRKYPTAKASYQDHSKFIAYRERYAFLFKYATTDYRNWAKGLLSAGYATNPKYASLLISLIEKYHLDQFDRPSGHKKDKKTGTAAAANIAKTTNTTAVPTATMVAGTVGINNKIKYVVAGPSDSYASLAKKFNLYKSDLKRYNDAPKQQDRPEPGTKVYLAPKKTKASRKNKTHITVKGDSYYSISQQYGVRLPYIRKYNLASPSDEPVPGDTVYLRNKKKKK